MYVNKQTFNSHPEKTDTEKEMQSYLFLEKIGVDYIRAEHDEATTIELCEEVEKVIDAKICKNLLLCNRQQTKFYMLLIPGDMPFKTKYLSAQINSSRLSFASGEQMEKLLNVSPGSLTVLSLMFDKEEKKVLLELICNEQVHMIIKDHTKYNSDKYQKLEELKVKIKDI